MLDRKIEFVIQDYRNANGQTVKMILANSAQIATEIVCEFTLQ